MSTNTAFTVLILVMTALVALTFLGDMASEDPGVMEYRPQ